MSHSSSSYKNWRSRIRAVALLIAIGVAGSSASTVRAQEVWQGDTDANWDTATNWVGDDPPDTGDSVVFGENGAAANRNNTNNRATANLASLNNITFSNVADATGNYTLNATAGSAGAAGTPMGLAGGITVDGTVATATNQTVNMLLTLSASQSFNVATAGAQLSIGQSIDLNGAQLDLTGAGNFSFGPVVTGAGGTFNMNSTGTLQSGAVTAPAGSVRITQSGGATFTGAVDAIVVQLLDTTGTIAFQDNLTVANNFQTAAEDYNLSLTGTASTITPATTLLNTGSVTLGDGTGDTTTFTGGLTATAASGINLAGTLVNGGTSTLGDADTGITLTTASTFSTNAVLAVNGVVGGAFGVTKSGTGDLTLSQDNTFTGAVAINGGKLSVSNIQNAGTASGLGTGAGVAQITMNNGRLELTGTTARTTDRAFDVDGGSSVDIADAAGQLTLTGTISGNGALNKGGAGTLVLNTASTFIGGTSINDGTLTLAVANAAGNTSNQFIRFGGDGNEVLNLAGAFTIVNDIRTVFDATFQTNGNDTTFTGAFITNATRTLDRVGGGTVTLTANSAAHAGVFDNNTGTVNFNGSSLGAATAAAGTFNNLATATLIGTGTAGTLNNSGGTLSPGTAGAPVGTMTAFDFNQTAGNFVVNLGADGTRDQVIANNNVAVNGTVTLQGDVNNQASYFGQTFNIVTADADGNNTGDITDGTFDSVTSNFTFLTPTLSVVNAGGNGPEFIQVSFNSFAVDLSSIAANPNQAAVAQAVQNIFTTGQASSEFASVFNQFFAASTPEQQAFLQQLAGEVGTANMTAALRSNASFTALALSQMQSSTFSGESGEGGNDDGGEEVSSAPTMAKFGMSTASGFGAMPGFDSMVSGMPGGEDAIVEDRDSVWVLGTGFWGDIDPTAVNQAYEYDGHGFVLGYTFGDGDENNWKWGVHGGFGENDIDAVAALENSNVDTWNVGVHGAYFEDGDYVNVVGGYNNNEFDTTRIFNIGTVAATSRANFDADELFGYVEIGHVYDLEEDDADVAQATPGRKTASGLMLGGMDAPHGKGAHKSHKRVEHKTVEPAEEPVQEAEEVEEEEEVVESSGEGWHVAPQLALQYRNYEQDAYTSTGAGALDQTVGPVELDMFQTGLGARFFHTSRTDGGGWIVPEVMVRWAHEFGDIDRTIRANFVGTNEVFAINGIRPDRDSLQLRAGVAAYTAKEWNVDLSYNGEFSENIENHAGVGKVTWFFD